MAAINWFEIPVIDIQRAQNFYETIPKIETPVMDLVEEMGSMLGTFPARGGVGGALVQNSEYGYMPSQEGALVYLTVRGDLDEALTRVEAAGGKILLPKTSLGENGFAAWIQDTEGNRVGLHASA